ncbi:seipin-2-like [Cynara cardunculus var. scolymus]|uniref:Adipose-regulatory protein, Seipin n=1 Tax=Cynara cardunculus var. scolymus TaxID=59895 RepID=A0A103XEU4_CYNCS|nr:seipin-2-like [Cynara cardunculus var. scolymus]KVH89458.1 Adipose-regulatory protein, Seipin [Cynara cardunculus var. scolymus]
MEQQSSNLISQDDTSKAIGGHEAEFHDPLEEFPFVDASNSFESEQQSLSSSELDTNKHEDSTVSVLSEHTTDSPSSPSSAGLRHRRLVSQRSDKGFSQSQFFKNNPDGLIDFDPHGAIVSPRKKHERSWSLKDDEKLNGKLDSGTVHLSSGGDGGQLKDETDESSVITSVNSGERVNDEYITSSDPPVSIAYLLYTLAELVIKAVGFQSNFLATSVTFPMWSMQSLYMFATDPFGIMMYGRNCILAIVSWIINLWTEKSDSRWKLCFRVGWGLLWLAYCGFILICLLVPAFLLGGIMMKWIVQEPLRITEQLTFDYSRDAPEAVVPIISCPDSSFLELSEKSKIGKTDESRVIPFGHELQATVSLTLPESDYNRNLGIFQVRVDFLSGDGKRLASIRQPSMLQFKSEPIRLVSTVLNLAPLLTGYSSETQTLNIKFKGYTEKDIPTSCSRVVLEKRAEFERGGGIPELYAASVKLESQLPFLKRMLWHWRIMIYLWISMMMFTVELLFTLLFCTPIVFPWLRSSNNNAYHNTPPGRS